MQTGYDFPWTTENASTEKLHKLFELSARKFSTDTALVFKNESLTFEQLNERADNLCHAILNWAYYEDFIGVSSTPSIEMVVSVLAVLKSGKAFIPIDSKASIQRNAQIAQDANLNFILAKEDEFELFSGLGMKVLFSDIDRNYRTINEKRIGQMAYIMFTSGSTCKPKGVIVNHASIVNYVMNACAEYIQLPGHTSGSFLQLPLTFDAALTSLFAPLICGKTLVISERTDNKTFLDPNFKKYAPFDFLKLTPLQLSWLEKAIGDNNTPICRHLVIGGDNLHARHFSFLIGKGLEMDIVNEYGPTEATVGCMTHRISLQGKVEDTPGGIPIGTAMKGCEIYILNDQLKSIGQGEIGEIYIGGKQVSSGYLMRPELNETLFVRHPLNNGERLYKTGDKATINEDGTAVYLDRYENIMEVNGVGIDYNLIEWEISRLEGVKQCEVVCKEIKGSKKLIAYLQPDGSGLDIESLPQQLSGHLPSDMMPQKFMAIIDWPYTLHGKLNKHALPIPACERHKSSVRRYPKSRIEKQLARLWCQLLQIEDVDIDSGFFELGGNHLLADHMSRTLQLKHNYSIDLATIYRCPSIACLSAEIELRQSKDKKPIRPKEIRGIQLSVNA